MFWIVEVPIKYTLISYMSRAPPGAVVCLKKTLVSHVLSVIIDIYHDSSYNLH